MLAALGGTEHSLGNARQPRAPTLTQQPPDLAFLHGCAQVLLEPDVPLDEAPLVQEDEDIRGGQRHLVDGEAVHVLEGLCDGGPVPQHRVECPKEVQQLGGGQGGPVGSQCHRLSKGCPGPGRSVGQRRKSKDTNRPPVTRVSSCDRHGQGLPAQGTGEASTPGEAEGPGVRLRLEAQEPLWKSQLTGSWAESPEARAPPRKTLVAADSSPSPRLSDSSQKAWEKPWDSTAQGQSRHGHWEEIRPSER